MTLVGEGKGGRGGRSPLQGYATIASTVRDTAGDCPAERGDESLLGRHLRLQLSRLLLLHQHQNPCKPLWAKQLRRIGELNPGLPRDRREY